MKPPVLPPEPADEYELRWFAIYGLGERMHVVERRALYHVRASWREVLPEAAPDSDWASDFVDDWMHFHDGRYEGRTLGWNWPMRYQREPWESAFETYDEAQKALVARLSAFAGELHGRHQATIQAMRAAARKYHVQEPLGGGHGPVRLKKNT